MNELIYQQGGVLYLDEAWPSQPSAATVTIRTLANKALSTVDASFDDIEAATATCSNMVLTLGAANAGAKVLSPTDTTGTLDVMTAPGYRLLVNRGGRKYYAKVDEYDAVGSEVSSLRMDDGLPFAIKTGDSAYGIRISYNVDWSAVTHTFTGQLKAVWSVTVGGVVHKVVKIYDVVKQVLMQPATWSDVLALRPDADTQLAHIADKERLVTQAWQTVVHDLYTLGIRHNLVVQDGSTTLRDATVYQTLYNLTAHAGLPVPISYSGQGSVYLDNLRRDRERTYSLLQFPVDENEDGVISSAEKNINRRGIFWRSPPGSRQRS